MNTKLNQQNALDQLQQYLREFPEEVQHLVPLISFTKDQHELFDRSVKPGHITASGLVLHPENPDQLLMVFHRTLERWLQPGGHVDPGETPEEAAIREVEEETGLTPKLHPIHEEKMYPFDINIHYIPTNKQRNEPGHFHYDFRYLMTTDDKKMVTNQEGNDVSWMNILEISDQSLARAIKQIQLV